PDSRNLRLADAGRDTAGCVVADGLWTRLDFRGVRQHPVDQARAGAGWLRLGHAGLRGRLWRLHGLVRLLFGCRIIEHVSRGEVGGDLGAARMARRRWVRDRLRRAPLSLRMESQNNP